MKKQILNLGKALNKAEQRNVFGGYEAECDSDMDCDSGMWCNEDTCRAICEGVYCQTAVTCADTNGASGGNSGPCTSV